MLGYLNRAVPLERLAEGESEEDRLFAQRVESIRRFAMEELGLSASKNYTRYVNLDRDYLAAVVSASAMDSFNTHQWWFPVVGRVPYKGFFNIEDARRERARLERRDLDVWIRRVDAFSTLGWFRDPLYSFMKNYPVYDLAELIIHELFHATVWLNSHVQFNEELATLVGREGARLYMEQSYGENWQDESDEEAVRADFAAYLSFLRGLIAELEELYNGPAAREEKLLRREEIIEEAKLRFEAEYEDNFTTDNFRSFSELPVNNAYLGLFRLYYEGDQYFNDLYERAGLGLPEFIAVTKSLKDLRSLNRGRGNPAEELERALGLRRGI